MELRNDAAIRDRLTAMIAAVALIVGLAAISIGRAENGVALTHDGEHVIVASVEPRSVAAAYGLEPGMVVTSLHDVTLVRMPQYIEEPLDGEFPPGPGSAPTFDPPSPVVERIDPALLEQLLSRPPTRLSAVRASDLAVTEPTWSVDLYDDGLDGIQMTLPTFVLGAFVLVLVGWWLASGRAGEGLRGLAAPLALATAMPFLVRPLDASYSTPVLAASAVLVTAAMLPLAMALIARIEDADDRRLVSLAAAGCAIGAAVVGIAAAGTQPWYGEGATRLALVAAVPLIPGLAAAGPVDRRGRLAAGGAGPASGRLLESAEYAVVGATPAVALATTGSWSPFPLVLWFAFILLAGRFTIRPLARLATRATLQRDLVVAATEAERARVAADIHDDALQELTLLVHRLDAAGDAEGADLARTVSDRLRAICGDLRLPILDDLGVGPALDWLVLRIERLAGGEVRLERADGTRPPADVELAFFRVAQEALANAVKHGRPPIVVRYATTPGGASLSIDDDGPGIDPDAGEGADRAGHFGLLNMQQRAEAIGAILDVRRWPGGGTHVALDWRAH